MHLVDSLHIETVVEPELPDQDQPELTLLKELDDRQNAVLEQLDALDQQVLSTLADWTRTTAVEAA